MPYIILLLLAFSITTAVSITLIGGRNLIGVDMNFINILKILFAWQFLVAAFFAFFSRILFMMINSEIYKIPSLAVSSTTITTFVTSFALVFVVAANYYFLGERITPIQGIGAILILAGTFVIMR